MNNSKAYVLFLLLGMLILTNLVLAAPVVKTIKVGNSPTTVAFNPSGSLAYAMGSYPSSNIISVINVSTNSTINTISLGINNPGGSPYQFSPKDIIFSPSGTLAYVTYTFGSRPPEAGAVIINAATNTVVTTLSNTIGISIGGAAISPSGTIMYIASPEYGLVEVVNVATNAMITTITVGSSPQGITFNPSGTLAYVIDSGSNLVSVINVATNTVITNITVGLAPQSLVFSPSGSTAYVTNQGSGTVSVINVSSNTVIKTIQTNENPQFIALNPSGSLAFVTNETVNQTSNTISVINTITGEVNTIIVGNSPSGIALSGNILYVTNQADNTISVINQNLVGITNVSKSTTTTSTISTTTTTTTILLSTSHTVSSDSLTSFWDGIVAWFENLLKSLGL